MDPFIQYAIAAAQLAVEDAGIPPGRLEATGCGSYVGSGIGGIGTIEEWHKVLLERGPDRVSPFFLDLDDHQRGVRPDLHPLRGQRPELRPRSPPARRDPRRRRVLPAHRPGRRRHHDRRRGRGPDHAARRGRVLRHEGPVRAERRAGEGLPAVRRRPRRVRHRRGRGHPRPRGARTCPAARGEDLRRGRRLRHDRATPTTPPRRPRTATGRPGHAPGPGRRRRSRRTTSSTSTPTAHRLRSTTRSRPRPSKRLFGAHARKLAVSSTKSMTGHAPRRGRRHRGGYLRPLPQAPDHAADDQLRESGPGLRPGLRPQHRPRRPRSSMP